MGSRTVTAVDVAIIGAGWYGLVTARTYLRLEPNTNVIILDSDSTVGGVWSKDRLYPNLVAQVKLGFFNYSDTPMSKQGATQSDLVTGTMIHEYLAKYAADHALLPRVRFNTTVERAVRCERGWRLFFKNSSDVMETEKLIVATGVTSIPSMPLIKTDNVSVPIVHSRDLGASYGTLRSEKIQNVVVVGAAKSAYDAVYLLLSLGKKVTWIIRPNGAGPLAILPTKLFGRFNSIAVASTRWMTYMSPSILNTDGPLYRLIHKSRLGRWCVGKFWDTVTYLSNRHAGYSDGDHVAGLKPEIDGKSVFWANSGLGVVTLPDFWPTIHAGDVRIVRDNLSTVTENMLLLESGMLIQTDFMVVCTGWGDHFAMFDDETKAELGLPTYNNNNNEQPSPSSSCRLSAADDIRWDQYDEAADKSVNERLPFLAQAPTCMNAHTNDVQPHRRWRLYRRSIPMQLALKNDRSLAIMGQIHTVQTPLVADIQSFWAILYLLGKLDLPHKETMAREIAEWNAWTRKRYLSQGEKFPYSLYDFLPCWNDAEDCARQYIDTLCKDLGISSRRKSNAFKELFQPYKPDDFNGFVDEYLAERPGAAGGR
ncbi:MAG: hypothetical protein Q9196_003362 [Gyalolechia fulgens]